MVFTGCTQNTEQLDALIKENESLKAQIEQLERKEKETAILKEELESLKYNPLIIFEQLNKFYNAKEYNRSLDLIYLLNNMHPASPETAKALEMKAAIMNIARTSSSIPAQVDAKMLREAKKAVKEYIDEAQGIIWYRDVASPTQTDVNAFYLYFGEKDPGLPWLKLRIQYAGEEMLNIQKYIIIVDGSEYSITPPKFSVSKDSTQELAWEWYDASVENSSYNMLKSIADSKMASITCAGENKSFTRTLSAKEKAALKHVIIIYEAAGGIIGK